MTKTESEGLRELRRLIDELLFAQDKLVCHGVAGDSHSTVSWASLERESARQAIEAHYAKVESERDGLAGKLAHREHRCPKCGTDRPYYDDLENMVRRLAVACGAAVARQDNPKHGCCRECGEAVGVHYAIEEVDDALATIPERLRTEASSDD